MTLKVEARMHHEVAPRAAANSVPVLCDPLEGGCGIQFAWPIERGNPVECPTCHTVEEIDLTPDPKVLAQVRLAQKGAVSGE